MDDDNTEKGHILRENWMDSLMGMLNLPCFWDIHNFSRELTIQIWNSKEGGTLKIKIWESTANR